MSGPGPALLTVTIAIRLGAIMLCNSVIFTAPARDDCAAGQTRAITPASASPASGKITHLLRNAAKKRPLDSVWGSIQSSLFRSDFWSSGASPYFYGQTLDV